MQYFYSFPWGYCVTYPNFLSMKDTDTHVYTGMSDFWDQSRGSVRIQHSWSRLRAELDG